ncbi:hypothetical protein [Snodgrassella gandavensis]|uniref:hypothetical protein n=1 Tax=Snodgrassella gandavensis TaxID=2946698 RepID=UPI001EF69994|nr:hypothetical protein [Snodgrassella gandavensis]
MIVLGMPQIQPITTSIFKNRLDVTLKIQPVIMIKSINMAKKAMMNKISPEFSVISSVNTLTNFKIGIFPPSAKSASSIGHALMIKVEKEHITRRKKTAPVYSFIIYILAYIDKPNQNLMTQ